VLLLFEELLDAGAAIVGDGNVLARDHHCNGKARGERYSHASSIA
jgi:hypothetical protein